MRMSPYEDWNVAFLPTEERWCAVLGLPRHPNQDALLFQKDVDDFLRTKMAQMDTIFAECDRTQDFGDLKKRQDDLNGAIRPFAGWCGSRTRRCRDYHVATGRVRNL